MRTIFSRSLVNSLAGVIALTFASPVLGQSQTDFSAYEGKALIKVGSGGTKITKNGIDYWTSGEPPRSFQVIGLIQDKRDEYWDGGHAVGSPLIAKKVKKAGGDAVIMESQEESGKGGGYGSGSGFFAFFASGGSKTVTRMLVVKYLPDNPATPVAAQTPAPKSQ